MTSRLWWNSSSPRARRSSASSRSTKRVPAADLSYEELLDQGHAERADIFSFDENSIAELFYTSGSTGDSQGRHAVPSHALSARAWPWRAYTASLKPSSICTPFRCSTPMAGAARRHPPCSGTKQIMVRRFDPVTVFRLIAGTSRHRHGAGPHHGQRFAQLSRSRRATISPACATSCWAAPLPRPN